jgi:hypothetical protein
VPSNIKRKQPGIIPMQSKKMKTLGAEEISMASRVTEVHLISSWVKREAFSIDQMERVPKDWTIREYEE